MLLKLASDRLALESFFKSTGGAGWYNKEGWMTDAELGDWHGVTVDAEGRVTKLELCDNGLAGPLPTDMQQLSALQRLDLSHNALTGPIPAELGQLGALTVLALEALDERERALRPGPRGTGAASGAYLALPGQQPALGPDPRGAR